MDQLKHNHPPTLLYMPPMPAITIPEVAHPQHDCAWCWYTVTNVPFPEDESSTICTAHQMWMLGRHRNILSGR